MTAPPADTPVPDGSSAREDRVGRLADEIARRFAAGETVPLEALAREFGLAVEEVVRVKRGLEAVAVAAAETPLSPLGTATAAPAATAPPALPADFEVLTELGRGGMGIVYKARQRSLDRTVAVKVLMPGEIVYGPAIDRFRREARTLARLRHPHIVAIHEVGETGGRVFYSMDWIEGGSLADLVRRGEVTPARAVRLVRQIASAIAHTHAHGLIHRDLKPANVLVDAAGDAYVSDFGLARDLAAGGDLTRTGQLLGTPAYMSPEQAAGETARIGEATDIYAIGAILYECLTARPPFAGARLPNLIHEIIHGDPPLPRRLNPRVPADLEVICLKAMAKEPARRYATARTLLEDLERFEEGRPIRARPPTFAYRAWRFGFRNRAPLGAGILGAAAVAALSWALVLPRIGVTPDALIATAAELHGAGRHEAATAVLERALDRVDGARVKRRFSRVRRGDEARLLEIHGALLRCRMETARERLLDGRPAEAIALAEKALVEADEGFHLLVEVPPAEWEDLRFELACLKADPTEDRRTVYQVRPAALRGLLDRLGPALADPAHPGHATALSTFLTAYGAVRFQGKADVANAWIAEQGERGVRMLEALISFAAAAGRDEGRPFVASDLVGIARAIAATPARAPMVTHLERTADDGTRPVGARTLAAFILCHLGDLPYGVEEVEKPLDEAAVGPAVELWREVHGLPRGASHRRRVERAIERVEGAVDRERWPLDEWLRLRTGHLGVVPDWPAWWRAHGAEDPRQWLAQALGLPDVPGEADLPDLAERFLRSHSPEREWLHFLMGLTLPETTPPPVWRFPEAYGPSTEWHRLLLAGTPRDCPSVLRVARLSDPEGALEWEEVREIRIGETVEVRRQGPVDDPWTVSGSGHPPGLGIFHRHGRAATRSWSIECTLRLGWEGPSRVLGWHVKEWHVTGGSRRGGWEFVTSEPVAGRVLSLSPRADPEPVASPIVAVLEAPGADKGPWTADRWRRRIAADLAAIAVAGAPPYGRWSSYFRTDHGPGSRVGGAVQIASVVPVPEAREALAQIHGRVAPLQPPPPGRETRGAYRRRIALAWALAGDRRALSSPAFDWGAGPLVAGRLLLAARDADVRREAAARLEGRDIPPELAAALERAIAAGRVEAPPGLAERVAGSAGRLAESEGPERPWSKLRALGPDLAPAVFLLALAAIAAAAAFSPGRSPRARLLPAAFSVAMGVLFIAFRLDVGGLRPRDALLDPVGYALAVGGSATLARSARAGWRRAGAPAMFAAALALDLLARLEPVYPAVWQPLAAIATIAAVCLIPWLTEALEAATPAGAAGGLTALGRALVIGAYGVPCLGLALQRRTDDVWVRTLGWERWTLLMAATGIAIGWALIRLLAAARRRRAAYGSTAPTPGAVG